MVISKTAIEKRIKEDKLVEPYKECNIKACSYDLTLGDEYSMWDPKSKSNEAVMKITNGVLSIPPDAICYVISKESLNMPNDLMASVSLSFGLIKQGVIIANQPPIDPNYSGKIVALLHNLSSKTINIPQDGHILSIVFTKLDKEVNDKYNGKYTIHSLADFCKEGPNKGALHNLQYDFQGLKRSSEIRFEKTMGIITFIVGVLTFLIAFNTISGFFGCTPNASSQNHSIEVQEQLDDADKPQHSESIQLRNNTDSEIIVKKENDVFIIDVLPKPVLPSSNEEEVNAEGSK